jgi:hypothetical protein
MAAARRTTAGDRRVTASDRGEKPSAPSSIGGDETIFYTAPPKTPGDRRQTVPARRMIVSDRAEGGSADEKKGLTTDGRRRIGG